MKRCIFDFRLVKADYITKVVKFEDSVVRKHEWTIIWMGHFVLSHERVEKISSDSYLVKQYTDLPTRPLRCEVPILEYSLTTFKYVDVFIYDISI